MLGRGYEYMDLEPEADATQYHPDDDAAQVAASGHGAGPLGFAGTATLETTRAAGLTTLAGDPLGGGPRIPMMPGTWDRPHRADNT